MTGSRPAGVRGADGGSPLPERGLAWAGLLARWAEFAQATKGFPRSATGDRWREAAAPIIGLQAVAFALGDIESLSRADRAAGLDRAEMLIRQHASALHALWRGRPMDAEVGALIEDAMAALAGTKCAGTEFVVAVEGFVMPGWPEVLASLGEGPDEAWAAMPGTRLGVGAPAAFLRPPAVAGRPGCDAAPRADMRQVYRQVGGDGALRDAVAPMAGLLPGRPLLLPMIERGAPTAWPDGAGAAQWVAEQAAACGEHAPPVIVLSPAVENSAREGRVEE